MSSEEPRRFGLTAAQFERVVTVLVAAPILLVGVVLAAWAYASSTGMIVFAVYAGGFIILALGYQLVTGRDIAHPPLRQPQPRL